jgi:hypothetical protein
MVTDVAWWRGCSTCDVVTINCPLHEGTRGMFNKEFIGKMKKGAYLVSTPASSEHFATACSIGMGSSAQCLCWNVRMQASYSPGFAP